MPPLEQFMEVSFEERRDLFFRDVERGDVIIGRINSIRDFGFFVTLICTYGDIERDIEDLELTVRLFGLLGTWFGNVVFSLMLLMTDLISLRPSVLSEMFHLMGIMTILFLIIKLVI